MYKMKIFPLLLLGLILLPESIVNAHPIQPPAAAMNETQHQTLECDACVYLANGVNETIIHNPKVLTIVDNDLEKMCAILPESVRSLCSQAAEQTAPLLLNHLGDFIVMEGCNDLGVCHSKMIH
jgi:hypothetical protein